MIGVAHGLVGVATAVFGSRFGRQRACFGHCRVRCEAERVVAETPSRTSGGNVEPGKWKEIHGSDMICRASTNRLLSVGDAAKPIAKPAADDDAEVLIECRNVYKSFGEKHIFCKVRALRCGVGKQSASLALLVRRCARIVTEQEAVIMDTDEYPALVASKPTRKERMEKKVEKQEKEEEKFEKELKVLKEKLKSQEEKLKIQEEELKSQKQLLFELYVRDVIMVAGEILKWSIKKRGESDGQGLQFFDPDPNVQRMVLLACRAYGEFGCTPSRPKLKAFQTLTRDVIQARNDAAHYPNLGALETMVHTCKMAIKTWPQLETEYPAQTKIISRYTTFKLLLPECFR